MPSESSDGDDWHPTDEVGMLRIMTTYLFDPTPRKSMARLSSITMVIIALFIMNPSACVSNPVPHPANGEGAAASGSAQGSTGSARDLAASEEQGEDGVFSDDNAEPSASVADTMVSEAVDAGVVDAAPSDIQDGQIDDAGPSEDSSPNDVGQDDGGTGDT